MLKLSGYGAESQGAETVDMFFVIMMETETVAPSHVLLNTSSFLIVDSKRLVKLSSVFSAMYAQLGEINYAEQIKTRRRLVHQI